MTEKEAAANAHVTPSAAVTGMTETAPPPAEPDLKKPDHTLRLWPGVLIVAMMWAAILLPGRLIEMNPMIGFMLAMYAPVSAALGLCVWYAFFSRRPWAESLGIPAAFLALGAGSVALAHETFRGFGHMLYGVPTVVSVWVGWLVLTGWLGWSWRRAGLLLGFLIVWGGCTLIRMDGVSGDFSPTLSLRWTATTEDTYQAQPVAPLPQAAGEAVTAGPVDWVGFRGPKMDGVRTGVTVGTGWEQDPPKELWKRRIGPGWGAITVVGDRAYTQEQRTKEEEAVVCLDANTGEPRWVHADPVRFNETVAGPGPRATPTFADGRVYALGAKGLLNCLDAATGKKLWSQDVAKDSGADVPTWGFSASPTVAYGLVTVYAGGKDGKAVLAYDAKTGDPKWTAGTGLNSYCSTQPMKLCGAEVLTVPTGYGLTVLDPKTGKVLMEYEWKIAEGMARCCQAVAVGPDEVVFGAGFGEGTRRLKLTRSADGTFTAEQLWATKKLNPYYNDHVAHAGHLYGIDGIFLVCIDLATGDLKWKARGYDAGQMMLLADQGMLLVVSEKGKVALVKATPESHQRVAQIDAIQGKTWNHPAVAGGRLFVRNGEWAAAYRLPAAN
ncbi:MAG: PQQ-binding-like beta-propeller repeat protein [Gemmataceae bacterium]